ncbi:hypothetical protein AAG747_11710 [Rapidithrix thailandica]|uniref:Uncharacterized protein n=1 Tax=Rapidithrix thailandica TaxID=413964 RepID=A0AAW9S6A1_9BACT
MNSSEDRIEFLVKQFMREVKRKMKEQEDKYKGHKSPSIDDFFNWFKDFTQPGSPSQEGQDTEGQQRNTEQDLQIELALLKEQAAQLKAQLKDKDDIIALLREQLKSKGKEE